MGLGPLHTVTLTEARVKALEARKLRLAGIDPLDARFAERAAAKLEAAKTMAFNECAEKYIEAHMAGWKNAKHQQQWTNTLESYAYPVFGDLPVQAIDTALVMKVIEPLWAEKTETASRLRGRIEAVLDWATVRTYRTGENPARWKGHLDHLLPERAKVARVRHHAALPYAEIGSFMSEAAELEGISASALRFMILTATRTSETLGATWSEVDLNEAIWIIPPERMKAGREHRVPLSGAARAILTGMKKIKLGEFVFPGGRPGRPLSSMALLMTLRRMKRDDLTGHGFRSTFRDWVAECTSFPAEVAEMALAHTVSDKVEAAYRRGDLLAKRRQIMEDWAQYCAAPNPSGKTA
jgi:integrase